MIHSPLVQLVLFPLAAYVIGSTPFGFLLAKCKGIDLRRAGSGNVGATNVVRVMGKQWGYPCFLLDVLKGFAPVLLAGMLLRDQPGFPTPMHQLGWLLVGCGAILGHVFTFYLKFRGGKGVATALGVVLGVYPYFTWAGLAAFGLWIVVTLISRYVSVGSIAAAAGFMAFFAAFNWPPEHLAKLWPMEIFAAAMVLLIVVRHRTNIRRLMNGTENKIGKKQETGNRE